MTLPITLKRKILNFCDSHKDVSWIDIVDAMEKEGYSRKRVHKKIERMVKKRTILFRRRNLPYSTSIAN